MKQFSSTELSTKTGDVLAAAAQRPVTIARHGKARFVVLTAEQFELLKRNNDSRTSVHVNDLSDDEADQLVAELKDSIEND